MSNLGVYRGAVYDTSDPESRGRLRILVPQVLGTEPSAWAEPSQVPAPQYEPAPNARVWVFFEGGDVNHPIYISADMVDAAKILAGSITTETLDAGVITVQLLTANNVLASAVNASDMTAVTITGATIQTDAAPLVGIKFDSIKFVAYDASGNPFLYVNPGEGLAIVAGEVRATTATVSQGTGLGGTTEIQRAEDGSPGKIIITASTTAPKSAPTIIPTYASVEFGAVPDSTPTAYRGFTSGSVTNGAFVPDLLLGELVDGNYYYTVVPYTPSGTLTHDVNMAIVAWDSSGNFLNMRPVVTPGGDLVIGTPHSITYGNGALWLLYQNASDVMRVIKLDEQRYYQSVITWPDARGTRLAAISYDHVGDASRPIVIAQSKSGNNKYEIQRYSETMTLFQSGETNIVSTTGLAGVLYVAAGATGHAAARYILSRRNSTDFDVVNVSTYNQVPGEQWPAGVGARVGLTRESGVYKCLDQTGHLVSYTDITTTTANDPNMTKWVSNTLANSTYETDQSPRASVAMPKRSRLQVTTSDINTGAGITFPDRVLIYIGQGATDPGRAQMARQTSPAVGDIQETYASLTAPPGANQPPTLNGFLVAGGTVQDVESAVGGFIIDGVSDGSVGTAGFRNSVAAAAGRVQAYTPVVSFASGSFVLGNGTLTGEFIERDHMVEFKIKLVIGTTTTFGTGAVAFSTPSTTATEEDDTAVGSAMFVDDSSGTRWGRVAGLNTTTTIRCYDAGSTGGAASTASPMAWDINDIISVVGRYKKA